MAQKTLAQLMQYCEYLSTMLKSIILNAVIQYLCYYTLCYSYYDLQKNLYNYSVP